MKLYDITVPVSARVPVWPGDPPPLFELAASLARGDACNLTRIVMGAHTATHVDAPLHFIDGGDPVDLIPLESLVGPCLVADCTGFDTVTAAALEGIPLERGGRLLVKTRNSLLWEERGPEFCEGFTSLDESAALLVASSGTVLLGIDYLSVEGFAAAAGNPVHRALLSAGVVIAEGLDLSAVPPGRYELFCLPLKLTGVEGAPARAVLRGPLT